MRKALPVKADEIVSFGQFSLRVNERLLTRNGVPLELGGRAMDVLLALIAKANLIVSKEELLAEAWPGVVISDGSLRYQITMLRQALGDGQDGARYVSNIVGRGYCFVAKISRTSSEPDVQVEQDESHLEPRLPAQPSLLVGRTEDLAAVTAQLTKGRFVTLVGTGGVGKTTVAIRAGHDLLADFAGAIVFVDLATLADPSLVPTAIASMLRLSVRSADPVPSLISYLRERRMLLILDNCEHVIAAAASLVERIFQAAPRIHILATSREALRVQGEYVHLLNPFASPPDLPGLGAREILMYPATHLFVHRAEASGSTLDLNGIDAPVIANICRKLDGVALAIELAARRVSTYGLHQTAALLDERLALSWLGQRGAQPRHQTLQAMLDWSYELLDVHERLVLCRLCVFVGYFSLDAARHVADAKDLSKEQIVNAIASLAEKSLLAIHQSGTLTRYRLLESTRTYALSKAGEETLDGASLRHALYFCDRLQQVATTHEASLRNAQHAPGDAFDVADLGNVRAALTWCFGRSRAPELAVSLASAAVPAFMAKSLLAECHSWSKQALAQLPPAMRCSAIEMHLQAAIGLSQMFTRGNSDEVRAALERSLEVAEALDDATSQVQLLGRLQIFHERIGDFVESLSYAHRCARVASTLGDAAAVAAANSLVGLCNHLLGDQPQARRLLEAAIAGSTDSLQDSSIYSGFDLRNRACIALARTLWLQGYPSQAVVLAQRAVDEARQLNHPVTLCIALIWAVSVYMWVGDLERAEQDINRFIAYAEAHSLTPYLAVGRGVKGELAVRRGDATRGVQAIQDCLVELRESRYELLTTAFNLTLAEGLTALGKTTDALELLDDTLALVHAKGDLYNLPELLRAKARALSRVSPSRKEEAEECLIQSLASSRHQGARAWELRTALDLARLWQAGGRKREAQSLLQSVLAHYTEGFETADLQDAEELLGQTNDASV
ncbi:putative ATPase/DNA-binding winged helix-turn-helix (wHTH) protein [Variovorax boronicumulans]|uniref:ATP-binding protein n=1 Tax=Variovorax boronicumulans TaxID=436515 RepID=UPI0024746E38|nr:winged helix-turn-helix domain-containing protein [Variovorax boronicumulans]MDH6170766.1 putative ATPase/DNA-binding winged helix-turn-helix (wHTH) protein [Variovorax boronicumulans]